MTKYIIMIVGGTLLVVAAEANKTLLTMSIPFTLKALSTGALIGLGAVVFNKIKNAPIR